MEFASDDMHRLFRLLNDELRIVDTHGEIYLVGGAVMCLAYGARPSTRDVGAAFRPSATIRQAAAPVASPNAAFRSPNLAVGNSIAFIDSETSIANDLQHSDLGGSVLMTDTDVNVSAPSLHTEGRG